ncbi:MAG TPA: acyl carrier protein [Candidatus Angelobacter sp.]|jgi:acyl carrier protein|nr:acyl carrier protein [Candidatus Angelobacter sp.]
MDADRVIPGPPAAQLRAALITALAHVAGRDPGAIDDSTVLADLAVDSLELTSVLLEMEDLLGSELSVDTLARFSEAHDLVVVGDLIRVLIDDPA